MGPGTAALRASLGHLAGRDTLVIIRQDGTAFRHRIEGTDLELLA